MLIIADVLSSEEVARVREGLTDAPMVDGKKTAGTEARKVKANRQANPADAGVQGLMRLVRRALDRNAVFQLYARPARLTGVRFNLYGEGEFYGPHLDEAMLDLGEVRLRTDCSFTLFLSEPESYDGGELVIAGTEGERQLKPRAGALVVYATGAVHQVNPVTRGERLAAVGWVQSLIRRPDAREVMFDLGRARASMAQGDACLLVDKAIANLMRIWGEP